MIDCIVKKHLSCKAEFEFMRTKVFIMSVTDTDLIEGQSKAVTQIMKQKKVVTAAQSFITPLSASSPSATSLLTTLSLATLSLAVSSFSTLSFTASLSAVTQLTEKELL